MSFKEKCPTCGTACNCEWVGLENVEASGDETMANKSYTPETPSTDNGWIEELRKFCQQEKDNATAAYLELPEDDKRGHVYSQLNIAFGMVLAKIPPPK